MAATAQALRQQNKPQTTTFLPLHLIVELLLLLSLVCTKHVYCNCGKPTLSLNQRSLLQKACSLSICSIAVLHQCSFSTARVCSLYTSYAGQIWCNLGLYIDALCHQLLQELQYLQIPQLTFGVLGEFVQHQMISSWA